MPNFYFSNLFLTSGILIFGALLSGRMSAQDLGVGEWTQEADEKCYDDLCLRQIQLQLHPLDPFSRPQIKFSVEERQSHKMLFEGAPCGVDKEARWNEPYNWVRAAVLVKSSSTADKQESHSWTLSVCLHRKTGAWDWPESFIVQRTYKDSKYVKERILKLRKS